MATSRRPIILNFLKLEATGGILLIIAALFALLVANSGLADLYVSTFDTLVAVQVGSFKIAKPLLLWINDGLMAIFFFLVGLEIKREFVAGELSSPGRIMLPALAALGGILVPALFYAGINAGDPRYLSGWAIPTATDIAFALGILALLGSRAPDSLKILLTAIAIIDDLGAILIIAFFYTDNLSLAALGGAGAFAAGLLVANRLGVLRPSIYILLGIGLWVCTLKSGVHATLAGVVTALAIPMKARPGQDGHTLLEDLEHALHPWVAGLILPLFAFANAGVSFAGIGLDSFLEPVKLGISVGLFAGKQIGVFAFLALAILLRLSPMPEGTNWRQLYGLALLCGVGFTMSLFIGSLAFEHAQFDAPIRLGVLTGSLLSGLAGYLLLRFGAGAPAQAKPLAA